VSNKRATGEPFLPGPLGSGQLLETPGRPPAHGCAGHPTGAVRSAQQLRQLGDIRRDPPRLIARQQFAQDG
jgi:hypothetical protein